MSGYLEAFHPDFCATLGTGITLVNLAEDVHLIEDVHQMSVLLICLDFSVTLNTLNLLDHLDGIEGHC